MKYEIVVKESTSYSKRKAKYMRGIIIMSSIAFCIVCLNSDIRIGFFFAFLVFIIQYIKASISNKFFVDEIIISEEIVKVSYRENDKPMDLQGAISDFVFKKKAGFSKVKTSYLLIRCRGTKVTQFDIADWNEAKFDEVVNSYNLPRKAK